MCCTFSGGYDAATLAQSCFRRLGALFVAIKELSERPLTVQDLADIGDYLADDWGGLLEAQCEGSQKASPVWRWKTSTPLMLTWTWSAPAGSMTMFGSPKTTKRLPAPVFFSLLAM